MYCIEELLKAVSPTSEVEQDTKSKSQSVQEHESIVLQYKELIREQDSQLNSLRTELAEIMVWLLLFAAL